MRGRPPTLFAGYWESPEETKNAQRGDWHVTGDIATIDADGFFWFLGRAADMLTSRGERFGPYATERVLRLHDAVAASAVVGVRDLQRGGQFLRAFVVLAPGVAGLGRAGGGAARGRDPVASRARGPARDRVRGRAADGAGRQGASPRAPRAARRGQASVGDSSDVGARARVPREPPAAARMERGRRRMDTPGCRGGSSQEDDHGLPDYIVLPGARAASRSPSPTRSVRSAVPSTGAGTGTEEPVVPSRRGARLRSSRKLRAFEPAPVAEAVPVQEPDPEPEPR